MRYFVVQLIHSKI